MLDKRAFLRIREGAFAYLLGADQAVSIERRNGGTLELVGDGHSAYVAWHLAGSDRVPIVRLGLVMGTDAAQWEYAIMLSGDGGHVGLAAEHVHVIPENEKPVVQPFNPPGSTIPGGSVITGICPGTEPEYLVLDVPRIQRCLLRAAA